MIPYNAAGRVIEIAEGERVTRYAYDPAGNLIGMKDAEGRSRRQESMDAYLAYISRTGSTLIGKS